MTPNDSVEPDRLPATPFAFGSLRSPQTRAGLNVRSSTQC